MSSQHRVDGVLDVGEDIDFERRWWRMERAIRVVQGLLLVVGLAGILGRGPLNEADAQSERQGLRVHYERVARFRTPTVLDITIKRPALTDSTARIWVSQRYLDAVPVSRTLPQPREVMLVADGQVYVFPVAPAADSAQLRFYLEPGSLGSQRGAVGPAGTRPVSFSQTVLP
jgi:hypothetical protein